MDFGTFKTYLRRDFKRTDKDTEILNAYNEMIVWISMIIPHGNYKFQSYLSTVVGQEDYPLPTNLIHLMHPIRLLLGMASSDTGYEMQKLTKEQYDDREPNPNRSNPQTSRPTAYCIYSRSILLTPIPDSANYLLEINWAKRPTDVDDDADTTDYPSEWDQVLKFGVLERLYGGLGMTDEANYWASRYRDQSDNPVGLCKRLLDAEMNRESVVIGRIRNNSL